MPQSYLNRLVLEHKRYYRGHIDELRRDMNYLDRSISASLQGSDEGLSGTNPKLAQRVAVRQGEFAIDYHILTYVLSSLEGTRDETHLNQARELLKKLQAVQTQTSLKK